MDPGGHILPLAYVITDFENDASWSWFFEQFKESYGVRQNMCFMSDRNESIWKGTATVIPSTIDLHAVAEGAKKYIVNLNTRMCSCGIFQYYEIPCGHVIAVLRYRKLHESDLCSPFYSLKNFIDAYAIPVEPIPSESTWDISIYVSEPKMLPPGPKRTTGIPTFERWKGFADLKFRRTKMTCSRCRQVGHNRKTCSNYPVQK
ncbi:uncharacterized protein [Solanum lycopersicum]|uniref:uncharacterized protein n=1 Tax=Solanum lycopersicum TaxID=4081 RepID=UPI0037489CD1